VGWGDVPVVHAERAFSNSLTLFHANKEGQCVGFVRAIGDGVLNAYIQDLIVAKPYRGEGLARKLLNTILLDLRDQLPDFATIGLMSVSGLEDFYASFGFVDRREVGHFGSGMTQQLSKLIME